MTSESRAPAGLDPSVPNVARMYDYLLGGKDNYAPDRAAADEVLTAVPEARAEAKHNRAFLHRAVRYLTDECGIRQFLDLGAGLPTTHNTHEIAHTLAPDARIVYVDHDAVVLAHARALLANGTPNVTVVQADLAQPDTILHAPEMRRLIDLEQPVGLLLIAVLHFLPDDDTAGRTVAQLRDTLAPGSALALSHATPRQPEAATRVEKVYEQANRPAKFSTPDQITPLFTGLNLVSPGLVPVADWRPYPADHTTNHPSDHPPTWILAGVGLVS